MFPTALFPGRYFTGSYWPKKGATSLVQIGGTWIEPVRSTVDQEVPRGIVVFEPQRPITIIELGRRV